MESTRPALAENDETPYEASPKDVPLLSAALWNTNRKPVVELVAKLANLHSLNLLVLLEICGSLADYLDALSEQTGLKWFFPWSNCDRVTILTTFPDQFVDAVNEGPHHTIRHIALPGIASFLLVGAHLKSQMHQSSDSMAYQATSLLESVRCAEAQVGHQRTILIGDFNMDPYDPAVLATHGAHAMMTRATASRGTRVIDGRTFQMLYNPMWGLFGDNSIGPPGTYRYMRAEHVCPEWHIFDQVLLRPELIPYFPLDDLCILDCAGDHSLLSVHGNPEPSDHLPVLFRLHEMETAL
jgi:hypothetical protein